MIEAEKVRENRFSDKSRSAPAVSKRWMITWNNPTIVLKDIHVLVGAHYSVGQLEAGLNGTPHLQFFQTFKKAIRMSHYKKYLPKAHVEVAIAITADCRKYVTKEETRQDGPFEYGEIPIHRNSKEDWESVYQKAKAGDIENIPADIRVRCYSNLKKIQKDNLKPVDAKDLRGVWIYGKSGVGKSFLANHLFPGAYPKTANKWWDGYIDQENVILNDLDDNHKCLAYHLKVWTDRYGVTLESKCSAVSAAYQTFCVTSQYSIDEIFTSEKDREALHRRFKVIHLPYKIVGYNSAGEFTLSISLEQLDKLTNVPRYEPGPKPVMSNIKPIIPMELDPEEPLTLEAYNRVKTAMIEAEHKLAICKEKLREVSDDYCLKIDIDLENI